MKKKKFDFEKIMQEANKIKSVPKRIDFLVLKKKENPPFAEKIQREIDKINDETYKEIVSIMAKEYNNVLEPKNWDEYKAHLLNETKKFIEYIRTNKYIGTLNINQAINKLNDKIIDYKREGVNYPDNIVREYYNNRLLKLLEVEKDTLEYEKKVKDDKLAEIKKYKQTKKNSKLENLPKLRNSAYRRFLWLVIISLLFLSICFFLAHKYSEVANIFQKINKFWVYITIVIQIFLILGWSIVGKERLFALGWPFNEIFKAK